MNLEEEFDDIFKQRAEEANFNFRESDWEKARKMIDKERMAAFHASSRINYWHVSALVLVISIALLYFALPEITPIAQADEVVYLPEEFSSTAHKTELQDAIKETNFIKNKLQAYSGSHKQSTTPIPQNTAVRGKQSYEKQKRFEPILHSDDPGTNTSFSNQIKEEEAMATSAVNESQSQEDFFTPYTTSEISELARKENPMSHTQLQTDLQLKPVFLKRYEDDYARKTKPKFVKSYLDASFGLIYSGGWEENESSSARGLNGYVGFNYGHFLSKKMSFSIGAELYNLSHINQEFYSTTYKNYNFGSVQTQTAITCQSMVFVSFPLKVYYSINPKHRIGLGVHAGNLVTSNNTIETSELVDGTKQNVTTESSKGVYDGMNTRNMMLSASLQKTIGNRISFQFEVYYGISDLFTDSPSNLNQQSYNSLRIGMNYRLFKN
ncbi:MAG: PorT family protein [Bacteroidia bacterium]|jgi:hypothetical protein|nr:PorT family protein [Bacteroidia bacterium]